MTSDGIVNWSVGKQYGLCDKDETTIHDLPILPFDFCSIIQPVQFVKWAIDMRRSQAKDLLCAVR
jgi:hypothetical protein